MCLDYDTMPVRYINAMFVIALVCQSSVGVVEQMLVWNLEVSSCFQTFVLGGIAV